MIQESEPYHPQRVEQRIQQFWEEHDIFQKSIDQRKTNPPYVFLEGPPTANGLPHPGHVLTRVMKDLICRYQTMNGHYIPRKAGWDTHGLPVEIEVEKLLDLHDKQDVESYGIKKFNDQCKKSVFKYENAWVELTRRIGFWLDMDNPYVTLKNEYIESVWWSLKQAWEKKLLFKGHKVVPYCPRCGTALSTHEISQGYKTVEDPSIFIKFKIKDTDEFLLAWTTTPWTLISNVALAVHPDETYIKIRHQGEILILAQERAAVLLKGEEYELLDQMTGKDLEHTSYEPLFTYAQPKKKAWYVVCADFVTMEDGTGIVHIAPAFGEDDYTIGRQYDLPVVQLVKLDGTFPAEVPTWAGQFVKEADPDIIKHLDERGLLLGSRTYAHEYPFCWRCNSPLLYFAMESWFIAMSQVKDTLVNNNDQINWYPEHLQQGRFGDFIRDVKDWALSRNRYWGTPLPIWTCTKDSCGHQICIGSVEELKSLSTSFPKDYDLHKPFVDELELHCPKCKATMIREKEVIDCWYDSGSAFFAQWHYPFENTEAFENNFPVDFICEALDQTRGWFYSLLAISTFLFEKPSYKTVLTLGLVLDKDNQKMSKSKRNYVDPIEILDREGADALRWYLFSANAPWNSTRFYEEAVKETLRKFLLTLWNSFHFFTSYASLDTFNPEEKTIPFNKRPLLDQWIISQYHGLVHSIELNMNSFETHKAARALEHFVINDFSNWYIRRSRKRLWVEEQSADKTAAYATMYDIFLGLSKLLAPFIPFSAEAIYQHLRTPSMPESVHLCDYPKKVPEKNQQLEEGMQIIQDLVEAGRGIRAKAGINVRYPLKHAWIIHQKQEKDKITPLLDLMKEELNVHTISFAPDTKEFIDTIIKPNYAILGPKFKQQAQQIGNLLEQQDQTRLHQQLQKEKKILLKHKKDTITLTEDDIQYEEAVKPHLAKTEVGSMTLVLDTSMTPEQQAEGLARELIRRIQSMRKELDLNLEAHITTSLSLDRIQQKQIEKWVTYIKEETRSDEIKFHDNPEGSLVKTWSIDTVSVTISITQK